DGILSCCSHQIFFAANDLDTAGYVSNSCGEKTVATVSTSRKYSLKYDPPSKNTSYRARLLISKEKVKQLPRHEEIIITESSVPVRAHKIRYFNDKNFKARLLPPPTLPKLRIISYGIPEFNIPSGGFIEKNNPDLNQMDIFGSKKQGLKADLSCWIDQPSLIDQESPDQDEAALILRLLSNINN
ncbi:MAG: type IV secretory system conjugative DNA transfer family protein, partial [Alphaproteobacteria bacterium]|nr:type IV secretory system conjugative DNA transfer family protein [Alphaproteobacteria bacterium]